MESVATLSVLRSQDGHFFHLEVPTGLATSPGQQMYAPSGLFGSTMLDRGLRRQLQHAIDAAIDGLHILYPRPGESNRIPDANANQTLERLGGLLFSLLPSTCQQALYTLPYNLPLLLLTNDSELPWELLYDGAQYLALKRPVGRQLLSTGPTQQHPDPEQLRRSFLFISNPEGDLTEADAEIEALIDAFDSTSERIDTSFLCRQQATRLAVREALASGEYSVIHYSGHARPGALQLADGELTAAEIRQTLRGRPFVFLNACSSAREGTAASETLERLPYAGVTVHNLASAFLLGGAIGLIGALWQVFDARSRKFAAQFYALTRQGAPVGDALQRTRQSTWPDLLWASYVLYGDPRLRIAGLEQREARRVTTLVARISGLASLFDLLDIESAADVTGQAIDLLTGIAEKYGGQVTGPLTDTLSVYFGVPKVYEDDAERAVRVALDMVHRWQAFSEQRSTPVQLGLQLGISSGRVAGRKVLTSEGTTYQVLGSVTAVAARLASQATIGQILLDEETRQRTQATFTFEALEPLTTAEGIRPVNTYHILGPKGTLPPTDTLVGRHRELLQLQDWWQEVKIGHGRVVGIAGTAGVGKTCLLQAFKATLPDQAYYWITAVCHTYHQSTPYSLLAQVVTGLARIAPENDEATRRGQLEKLVRRVIPNTDVKAEMQRQEGMALLAQVIGLPFSVPTVATLDPKLRQRNMAGIVQALLARQAVQAPLIILLEDLQWVDEVSLTVLNQVAGAVGRMPLLFVATYRPDWSHEWTRWSYYRHLSLEELDEKGQRLLLANLLSVETAPPTLAKTILNRTGGNPFFIEEVVRSLQESGVLRRSEHAWWLVTDLEETPVPDRVEGVILARIDQLAEASRAVLRMAAVIGEAFEYQILEGVQDEAGRTHLDQSLNELAQRDLILATGGWWPHVNYAFRHSLIHQTTYLHLMDRLRRTIHRLVAQALRRLYGDEEGSVLERTAYHYYHSDDRTNAVRYCLQAARRAAEAWANQTALAWYDRALEMVLSFDETPINETERAQGTTQRQILEWKIEALSGKGEVQVAIGDNEAAIKGYERALGLATGIKEFPVTRRADLHYKMAIAYHDQGAFDVAQTVLNQGLQVLNGLACLEAGRLLVWIGLLHFRSGRLSEALASCEQGIVFIGQTESVRDHAQAYNLQGIIYRNMGDSQKAISAHEQSISLYERIEYLPGLERAYSNLGCVYQDLTRWQETLSYFQKSAELSDRIGEERRRAAAGINLGEIYYLKGQLDQAIELCEQARQMAQAFGFEEYIELASLNLGKSYLKKGDVVKAGRYLEESLTICQRLKSNVYRPEILCHLAKLNVANKRLDEALKQAQEAVSLAVKMGRRGVGQGYRVLGLVHRTLGQLETADTHLGESLTVLEEQNSPYEVGLTLVELALLRQAQLDTGGDSDTLRQQGIATCDRASEIFNKLGAGLDLKVTQEVRRALQN